MTIQTIFENLISTMYKYLMIALFLFGAPILAMYALKTGVQATPAAVPGLQIFTALPDNPGVVESSVIGADARVIILEQYLNSFNSPLASQSAKLVEEADKHELDFRLLAAISRQESNGCKIIPPGSYNCWGWGIHERGTLHFESFEQGIETVSAGLKKNYIDRGLVTPEQIMSKYTPSSPGTWSNAVRLFMGHME